MKTMIMKNNGAKVQSKINKKKDIVLYTQLLQKTKSVAKS
jgi:hypothetical protein